MADEVEFRVTYDYIEWDVELLEDEDGSPVYDEHSYNATDYYYLYAENEEQARSRALNDLKYLEAVEIWDVEEVN